MSTTLSTLADLLRRLPPAERRVVAVLLPALLTAPNAPRSAAAREALPHPLDGMRVTIDLPRGAGALGEVILGALATVGTLDDVGDGAVQVTSPRGEKALVKLDRESLADAGPKLPPGQQDAYNLLVQADERGLSVADVAKHLDLTSYTAGQHMRALRRRSLAFCARSLSHTVARWALTQDAAEHALALALGMTPMAPLVTP